MYFGDIFEWYRYRISMAIEMDMGECRNEYQKWLFRWFYMRVGATINIDGQVERDMSMSMTNQTA